MIPLVIIVPLRVSLFQRSLFSHQSNEGSFYTNNLSIMPSCEIHAANYHSGGTGVAEQPVPHALWQSPSKPVLPASHSGSWYAGTCLGTLLGSCLQ